MNQSEAYRSKVQLTKDTTHWKAHFQLYDPQELDRFRPNQIPPDWELAMQHAQAVRVAREKGNSNAEVCPCCGYEIDRADIDLCADTSYFAFLGSGVPMYFNFFLYSTFLLFEFFIVVGLFNLVTNLMGDPCPKHLTDCKSASTSISHITSMANQSDPQMLYYQSCSKFIFVIILIFTLTLFRRSQRIIHNQVDESQISPSDYTVMIKNIPLNQKVDYYEVLRNICENYAVPGEKVKVTKISLIYNTEALLKIQENIKGEIALIQKHLIRNKLNHQDPKIFEMWSVVEGLEDEKSRIILEILESPEHFVGMALTILFSERQKQMILRYNTTSFQERMKIFFAGGISNVKPSDLQWGKQKLLCEQAPEPNEIDWESIHIPTKQKITLRLFLNSLAVLFMVFFFTVVFLLSYLQDYYAEQAQKEVGRNLSKSQEFAIISWVINLSIVIFNKFIIGSVIHHICDHERVSTLTRLNISFAIKNSIALFFNTAIMSFIIDVLMFKNVLGSQGFIINESILFMLNSMFSPLVWLLDPWILIQKFRFRREYTKGNKSVLTQQQAHDLAEKPDYFIAKRYSDLIKTMWTAFLYGTVLPLGILYSFAGLSMYYFIDKYNLSTRRSCKQSIGKELARMMNEFLEMIVPFVCLGDLVFRYLLHSSANYIDIICLLIALVYAPLPKDKINILLFPLYSEDEDIPYDQAVENFDTDYDRENPVTRKAALEDWRKNV